MNVIPTTPPRSVDVTAIFPQLAPLARTATRLHPRPGSPSPRDSSVGGPLLWPVNEPWPRCDGPHEVDGLNLAMSPADVRLERRIRAATRGRRPTPLEREALERIRPPREYPLKPAVAQRYDGSLAMLPVAQLYVRDVPDLHTPDGADLLQVLWCPFDHPIMPRTALFWRSAATVTDILTTPPQPPAMQFGDYLPEPCLLNPERVTEYPDPMELNKELREPLGNWNTWQAADATVDSSYASCPQEFYDNELSVAPGWKVGGWASWGPTDPVLQFCRACDAKMDPLLTIATFEWDDSNRGWIPDEDYADQRRAKASSTRTGPEAQTVIDFFRAEGVEVHDRGRVPLETRAAPPVTNLAPRQPTVVQIGSGYKQQLYVCPTSPEHPHTELMQ